MFLFAAALIATFPSSPGQEALPPGAAPVLAADSWLQVPVAGLERTDATAKVVPANGAGFDQALRVEIKKAVSESNATQLTLPNAVAVKKGDVLLASFWLRGKGSDGKAAGRIEFLFEKSTDPWTKSISRGAVAAIDGKTWKQVLIPFQSAENYEPGEAMASFRLAFEPQWIEIGGVGIGNYGTKRTLDELSQYVITRTPLGTATVSVNLKDLRQTMMGLGGNFCQPRYGRTEPMDEVGRYVLDNLQVVHARIGLPLNNWNPEPGVYRDDAQAKASLLALQEMSRRKIPTVVSVWEGPLWMLGGRPEQMGRVLPERLYKECAEAITKYLVLARDKYRSTPEYFSFNEADYGVNFRFSPQQIAAFIRVAGPMFEKNGLKTKFLVGDTANGTNTYHYSLPLLEDKALAKYLGPIAFHSWDALGATEKSYTDIAKLGKQYKKEVWCLEAGHDAQLWQAPNPWGSWENAIRTAMAYERTIRLTETSLMDYWTYQDNYPLVDKEGPRPYPVFHVMKQMEAVFAPGARVARATADKDDLQVLPTVRAKGFAMLLVNPIGEGQANVAGLPARTRVRVVTSDATSQNRESNLQVDGSGRLAVKLPARSVVTLVGR